MALFSLWERACSRRRSVSRRICKLTHRFREQARSHRDFGGCWDVKSPRNCEVAGAFCGCASDHSSATESLLWRF
ncbi:hypothetical protein BSZ28_24790 [Pseudomonas moraviensis]|nr:hypothetical protein BSZ28_24790 [Pseudomonas moraviensis]